MKEIVYEGKFLKMVKLNGWEYVERTNATGVVIIAAFTEDAKMLLVEQFRPPVGKRCIEMPAGLAGDKGPESNLEAVRRELAEETGYKAKDVIYMGDGVSTPGLTSEMAGIYFATGLTKLPNPPKDESENIILHEVSFAEFPHWVELQRKEGKLIDWKIYAGLVFFMSTLEI